MTQLKNDRILRALRREPIDRTPIWIMRQAGRYLPEYRALRAEAGSFLKLCKTPELACEVTLQPLARFPLDAAILFSDILTIPDAMGLGLYFQEGEGPGFLRPLRTEREINALSVPDPEISLRYVLDAIRLIDRELAGSVPLIGFCGSPWTVGCYMVEGKANKSFPMINAMRQEQPKILHTLLDTLARSIAAHLSAQIKAGVQVVMLFDTWGGMLDTENYKEFSLRYLQQIIAEVKNEHNVPIILFTKGGGKWLNIMAETNCDALGLDWLTTLKDARQQVGDRVALQGNMNPEVLYSSPDEIRAEVATILESYGQGSGHIFNLGHGIIKDINPEHVSVLVDAVHTLSRPYHT
jgi:uroporphyrinogen decarboxylase